MRTLALVPCRAGSKGIPGKNTRQFAGMPLFGLAVDIGLDTCNEVLVTTDDEAVLGLSKAYGARTILRPSELAQDDTPMLAVVKHAVATLPKDIEVIVLLQPTQPLRRRSHVNSALAVLEQTGADSVVSVVQIPAHYSPDYVWDIEDGRLWPWDTKGSREYPLRRQDARPAYSREGTVYAMKRGTIEAGSLYGSHCVPLVIPPNESCNLDTEEDWQRAEAMMRTNA